MTPQEYKLLKTLREGNLQRLSGYFKDYDFNAPINKEAKDDNELSDLWTVALLREVRI